MFKLFGCRHKYKSVNSYKTCTEFINVFVCEKCGKMNESNISINDHVYELFHTTKVHSNWAKDVIGITWTLRCKKCGTMINEEV